MGSDDARVQTEHDELARPVVRAGAGLHRNDAAGGQLCAPGQEPVARQGAAGEHAPGAIDAARLDHALGQIDPDGYGSTSCNLAHGLPLSTLQVDDLHHQSWRFDAVAGMWEVPSYSVRADSPRGTGVCGSTQSIAV